MLWLEHMLCSASQNASETQAEYLKPLKLVDVGCGYGDMLRQIERWAAKRNVAMDLLGVDVNANAIRAAREAAPAVSRVRYAVGDVCACAEAQNADLITVSAVTHHLSESEILRLLQWMGRTARVGWIITDLHRMPTPYRAFSVLARGPWWHRFIRPDGLASIRRAFREEDWVRMCAAAGMQQDAVEIRTHRPARLAVSSKQPASHSRAGPDSRMSERSDVELPQVS